MKNNRNSYKKRNRSSEENNKPRKLKTRGINEEKMDNLISNNNGILTKNYQFL